MDCKREFTMIIQIQSCSAQSNGKKYIERAERNTTYRYNMFILKEKYIWPVLQVPGFFNMSPPGSAHY